jgi:hypothetical protein
MTPNDNTDETDETSGTDELIECEYCGEEFSEGSNDLQFHWYSDHPYEVADDDEQKIHEAVAEHHARLIGIIDIEVPVTIPQETWEDVVAFEFDDENPEDVAPGDISKGTLVGLVEPEYHFRVAGRESAFDEGLRRDDEFDFRPEVHIDVPRRTFERVLERARIEESVDDVTPYEHGEAPDEIAEQLVEFYLPEYTWHVKDDED